MEAKSDFNSLPKIWIDILAFAALLLGAFFIYRNGIVALPRADQINFLRERELLSSDWEYFWHMLVRNRGASFLISADVFLFRPFFHAFLVIIDIFFRHNLYVTGAIGILLHGVTCFSVYLLISQLTNRFFSFLSSIFLLTQYVGIEMIRWTHINGYLIALTLFTLGFFLILRSQQKGKLNIPLIVSFFLCASLIHELFAHVLFLSSLVFAFSFKDAHKKKIWFICFLPFVLYLFLDVLSLFYSKPASFLSSLDQPMGFTFSNIFSSILFLSGVFLSVFFLPNIVSLSKKALVQAAWDVTTLSPFLMYVVGFGLILILASSFLFFLKRYQCETNGKTFSFALGVVITICMVMIILELVVGRIALRSFDYMKSATYYYYLSNYVLLVLAVLLYREFRESNWLGRYWWKRPLFSLMPLLVLWQIPYSYPKIQEITTADNITGKIVAHTTLRIANYIRENKNLCYGGTINAMFWGITPDYLFYRQHCNDDAKEPRYGTLSPDKQSWLVKLNVKQDVLQSNSLTPHDFSQENISLFALSPVPESLQGRVILVSKESHNPVYFSVSFHGIEDAGLLLSYRDPQNFVLLTLWRYQFFLYVVENGQIRSGFLTKSYYWNGSDFKLSVIKLGTTCLFLFNNNVLTWFEGISSLEGKVGFYFRKVSGSQNAFLAEPLISESNPDTNNIRLEPDLNLVL